MIATALAGIGPNGLKIWNANTGQLLKTFEGDFRCLAWTSDGKTLFAGGANIDTATWTVLDLREIDVNTILLSPNERILASTSHKTVQLWNLKTNKLIETLHHQPIGSSGTPLRLQDNVNSATFSADGKFLVTSRHDHIYTWDVSAIVKDAGLLSDTADAIPRPAPKMNSAPRARIPQGFFDDALREANLRIRLSQSHGPHNCPTPVPPQRTLSPFASFWRRFKPNGATESNPKSRSRPLSWTRNLVSGIVRRRNGSDIQLREVEVPHTAGKPRNYHARKKKPAASSSRPSNTHATQQSNTATQSTPSSSQQPPPTAAASTPSAVTGAAGTTGTLSRPHITIAGWRARFVGWLCCIPIQNTNGQP
ncbi:hypothetical protein BDR05DRAFT_962565 [Suillus weaverae]|nr:hypothetical protein BDR05DRAFT_962565 [Suillus weaverae]